MKNILGAKHPCLEKPEVSTLMIRPSATDRILPQRHPNTCGLFYHFHFLLISFGQPKQASNLPHSTSVGSLRLAANRFTLPWQGQGTISCISPDLHRSSNSVLKSLTPSAPNTRKIPRGQSHNLMGKNMDLGVIDSWVHVSASPLGTYPL